MKDGAHPDPDSRVFAAESVGRNLRVNCILYLPHLVALPTHIPFAFLQEMTSCELSLENEIANV